MTPPASITWLLQRINCRRPQTLPVTVEDHITIRTIEPPALPLFLKPFLNCCSRYCKEVFNPLSLHPSLYVYTHTMWVCLNCCSRYCKEDFKINENLHFFSYDGVWFVWLVQTMSYGSSLRSSQISCYF